MSLWSWVFDVKRIFCSRSIRQGHCHTIRKRHQQLLDIFDSSILILTYTDCSKKKTWSISQFYHPFYPQSWIVEYCIFFDTYRQFAPPSPPQNCRCLLWISVPALSLWTRRTQSSLWSQVFMCRNSTEVFQPSKNIRVNPWFYMILFIIQL